MHCQCLNGLESIHFSSPAAAMFVENEFNSCVGDVVDYVTVDHLSIIIGGTVAQLLALLALPPQSKKVMGSIPALGAVDSWGEVLPRLHSAQMVYLPGLSVWSLHVLPVFTRGFLH